MVRRPRLVCRLTADREAGVAVVVAPAGYGKTTLLSEWEETDARPFAWVMVDERHNDPAFLFDSIARSLHEIEPVHDGVFAALSNTRPGIENVVVPRLLESLAEREQPTVIVLDDAHALGGMELFEPLTVVAEQLPAGSQLVLASRREPAMPLGRLRAERRLVELHAGDLMMTRAEAHQLLRASGIEVTREAVGRLLDRTEGWPAALYLAALALHDEDNLEGAVEAFTGDDRLVADYLRDELMSGLTADELGFLTRTSILEELSGPICDAVLRDRGSAEKLRSLSRSNLLLMPLDRRDQRFRYHALLREMLRSELARRDEDGVRELHARASAWYLEHGDTDSGIEHSISSGDAPGAASLIWAHAADYASRGREATLRRWIERFSPERIAAHPALALSLATSHMSRGEGAECEHWTSAAMRSLSSAPAAERASLEVGATVIRASGAPRDGIARMAEEIAGVHELLPEDSPWRALCCLVEGAAHHLSGDRERARPMLEEGARRGAASAPTLEVLCLAQLALLSLDEGDAAGAAALASQSATGAERSGVEDSTTTIVFATSALTLARAGRVDEATRCVKASTRILAGFSDFAPWYEAEARIILARALLLLDDVAGARHHLQDAAGYMRGVPDATVLADWHREAQREADLVSANGRWPLTAAEVRVLHYLPTHLSFREIAERLLVSTNTVKTQAGAVYRKLDVSSRAEAVETARAGGLLDEAGTR